MARGYRDPTADEAVSLVTREERMENRRLERDIVAEILHMLRERPDTFCWKEHGGMYGQAGIPDIICCIQGRFVAFEVKTSTGRLSKLQEITLRRIRDAGGQAYVVRSADDAEAILDGIC